MKSEVLEILEKNKKMICRKCKKEKDIDQFSPCKMRKNGRVTQCHKCRQEVMTAWKKKHPDNLLASLKRQIIRRPNMLKEYGLKYKGRYRERYKTTRRLYRLEHKEEIKQNKIKWKRNNPEKNLEKNREKKLRYKIAHPEKVREGKRIYMAKRRIRDSMYRLRCQISNSVRKSLHGNKQGRKWENLVGYSCSDLRHHLENQFLPGMSWENMGAWHIDHKIPVSAFNFQKPEDIDFKKCFSLSNLQPLWRIDNLEKHAKLTIPHQPSLIF